MRSGSEAEEGLLGGAGDYGFGWLVAAGAMGDHVDFAADAELAREVEAGLDGEAGVGQEQAFVVGFEVVEVGAVAVELGCDVVAGAVGEPGGEAGGGDEIAGGVVGLPAVDGDVGGVGVFDGFTGGEARVADGVEDLGFAGGGGAVEDSGPGDVVPDGLGVVGQLGPDVDEEEVAVADGAGGVGGGFVVGVGGVGAGGAVGPVVGEEAFAGDALLEEGDDVVFGEGAVGADRVGDVLPAGGEDAVEAHLGFVVGGDLGFGEDGFELADEVGRGTDIFAEAADELDGAGVDHGDVHDGVARGVLHGDGVRGREHFGEGGFKLLPGAVFVLGARQSVEFSSFDAVDELLGLAVCGDEVEPAAGDEGFLVEREDAIGDGVAMVVVVEEPAVEGLVADCLLERGEVHRG